MASMKREPFLFIATWLVYYPWKATLPGNISNDWVFFIVCLWTRTWMNRISKISTAPISSFVHGWSFWTTLHKNESILCLIYGFFCGHNEKKTILFVSHWLSLDPLRHFLIHQLQSRSQFRNICHFSWFFFLSSFHKEPVRARKREYRVAKFDKLVERNVSMTIDWFFFTEMASNRIKYSSEGVNKSITKRTRTRRNPSRARTNRRRAKWDGGSVVGRFPPFSGCLLFFFRCTASEMILAMIRDDPIHERTNRRRAKGDDCQLLPLCRCR